MDMVYTSAIGCCSHLSISEHWKATPSGTFALSARTEVMPFFANFRTFKGI